VNSQEVVKKLILYAELKIHLRDPEGFEAGSPTQNMAQARKLKKELLEAGISSELLNLTGDEIAQAIHESLSKRGYA